MESPQTGQKVRIPFTEYLKGIPEMVGIRFNEEPTYEVLEKDGAVEIRRYEAMATASTPLNDASETAREEAFKRLASYIFGENSSKDKISMTSPVLENAERGMIFVLPKRIREEGAPSPVDPHITLRTIPERVVATIRYSGENTDELFAEKKHELINWLSSRRDYHLKGEPFSAEYDPPHSIDATKRNEVHVVVESLQ